MRCYGGAAGQIHRTPEFSFSRTESLPSVNGNLNLSSGLIIANDSSIPLSIFQSSMSPGTRRGESDRKLSLQSTHRHAKRNHFQPAKLYPGYQGGRKNAHRVSDDETDVWSREVAGEAVVGQDGEWTPEIHRCFAQAIYEIGVKQSSPSVILENMQSKQKSMTSERVKSHLQKYRLSKARADEFLSAYDAWMSKAREVKSESKFASPSAILKMISTNGLTGGDLAGYLSFAVLQESESEEQATGQPESDDFMRYFSGSIEDSLEFPDLTPAERETPVGRALSTVQTLFTALTDQLAQKRGIPASPTAQHQPDPTDTLLTPEAWECAATTTI